MTGIALGSPKLYAFLDGTDIVEFAPISEQTGPTATAEFSPFFPINSAVEVDLFGQLNSELAGGWYVGAVGGQADFYRAGHCSHGGLAIVALASASPSGESRIVPRSGHGMVTALKSDVDVIVTEWGSGRARCGSAWSGWRRWRIPITGKHSRPAVRPGCNSRGRVQGSQRQQLGDARLVADLGGDRDRDRGDLRARHHRLRPGWLCCSAPSSGSCAPSSGSCAPSSGSCAPSSGSCRTSSTPPSSPTLAPPGTITSA